MPGFTTIIFIFLLKVSSINIDFLDPLEIAFSEIDFTDLFFSELKDYESALPDTNIVIVNVSRYPRNLIAQQIEKINKHNPKVVALDIVFDMHEDEYGDSLLAEALSETNNLIMASIIEKDSDNNYKIKKSLPEFTTNAVEVHTNFVESSSFRTIREFNTKQNYYNIEFRSFAEKIVEYYDTIAYKNFIKRDNSSEIINYKGNINKFYYLDANEVFDDNIDLSFVENKIVLFGFMGERFDLSSYDFEDKFFTPLNDEIFGRSFPDMYGVVIHANIISMILNNKYIGHPNLFIYTLIALLFLILVSIPLIIIFDKLRPWYGIIGRFSFIVATMTIFFISYIIFFTFYIKIELSFILLTLIIHPDILEIYLRKQKKEV